MMVAGHISRSSRIREAIVILPSALSNVFKGLGVALPLLFETMGSNNRAVKQYSRARGEAHERQYKGFYPTGQTQLMRRRDD